MKTKRPISNLFNKLIAWCEAHPHKVPSLSKQDEAPLARLLYTLRSAKRGNTVSRTKYFPIYAKIAKEHNLNSLFDLRRKPAQAMIAA